MGVLAKIIGYGIAGVGAVGVGYAGLAGQDETTRDQSGTVIEGGEVGVFRIRIGDCLRDMPTGAIEALDAVPCSQAHGQEVYGAFNLPGGSDAVFPGEHDVSTDAEEGCSAKFPSFVGLSYEDSVYGINFLTPTKLSWDELDDREVLCLVNMYNGTNTRGSARGTRQ